MTGLAIGAGITLAAGAYLRWGAQPVLVAFELGRVYARLQVARRRKAAHRAAREHASWN